MHALTLPRLGQTMERATLRAWLKREGEPYRIDDELYEIETDKSTLVVEAKRPGMLVKIVAREGADLPVGAVLAVSAEPGEADDPGRVALVLAGAQGEAAPLPAAAAPPAPDAGQRIRAMPKARALAAERGIHLARVQGSGPDGVITPDDVRRAGSAPAGPAIRERRPLAGIARAMAETMEKSRQIPQFVQIAHVDATAVLRRKRAAADSLSLTDLFIDAVVQAARAAPDAIASYRGDEILFYDDLNVAIATSTAHGLLLPVLHRAQTMDMQARHDALVRLLDAARRGQLSPDAMSGGTITISNLGTHGIETGAPLITPPQACLVFFGAIEDRPIAIDGRIEARRTLYISVAFDHRVIDGVGGARFTTALKAALEAA